MQKLKILKALLFLLSFSLSQQSLAEKKNTSNSTPSTTNQADKERQKQIVEYVNTHTDAEIKAAQVKFGVSDQELKAASDISKGRKDQIVEYVKTHTDAEVKAAQVKFGVSDQELKTATTTTSKSDKKQGSPAAANASTPTANVEKSRQDQIVEYVGTHTDAEIKAAQIKFGVNDQELKTASDISKGRKDQIVEYVKKHTPEEIKAAQLKFGVSDEELKTATSIPKSRQEQIIEYVKTHTPEEIKAAQLKFGVSDKELASAVEKSSNPNNYIPYAKNLTPAQAKQISDKYKSVYGYFPSPSALELYGYRISPKATYPQTIDQLVNSIEKKTFNVPNNKTNLMDALNAGIDPDVFTASLSVSSSLDWNTILNSTNPNEALRLSLKEVLSNTTKSTIISSNDKYHTTLASSGNLIIKQYTDCETCLSVTLVDKAGNTIRSGIPFNGKGLIDAAYTYGLTFDSNFKNSLNSIADQLDASGIKYQPGTVYAGRGTGAGINLRDLAKGGTGMSSVPTMQHAIWQGEVSAKFFGDDHNSSLYTSPIQNQASLEYMANALNIDLANQSSSYPTLTPLKDNNGTIRNYMVQTPGGSMGWYATIEEAQAFVTKSGGKAYDLRKESPNLSHTTTVQERNFNPPTISLSGLGIKMGAINSSMALHAINNKKKADDEMRIIHETKSNPNTCQINIMSDLQIAASSVSAAVNQKITSSNNQLSSRCKDAKAQDLNGAKSALFLNEYDYQLAHANLEIINDQLQAREVILQGELGKKINSNGLKATSSLESIASTANQIEIAEKLIRQSYTQNSNTERLLAGINKNNSSYGSEIKNIQERANLFSLNDPNAIKDEKIENANKADLKRGPASTDLDISLAKNNDVIEIDEFIEYKNKNRRVLNSLNSNENDSLFETIKKAYLRNYDKLR